MRAHAERLNGAGDAATPIFMFEREDRIVLRPSDVTACRATPEGVALGLSEAAWASLKGDGGFMLAERGRVLARGEALALEPGGVLRVETRATPALRELIPGC